MNIIERGKAFVESLRALAARTAWDWQRCPSCGNTLTIKNGSYTRRPWFLSGRQCVRVQRHWCQACAKSYSEQSALLVRGSWYSREVRRSAVDHWHDWPANRGRMSLRRTAEFLRSWLGRQERWRLWRPLDTTPPGAPCYLAASTVHRWHLRSCGRGGAGQRTRAMAGHCAKHRTGDGWSVGAAARRRHPGGVAAGRQCHRAAVAAAGG